MTNTKILKDVRCNKCGRLLCRSYGEVEIKCRNIKCKDEKIIRVNNNTININGKFRQNC